MTQIERQSLTEALTCIGWLAETLTCWTDGPWWWTNMSSFGEPIQICLQTFETSRYSILARLSTVECKGWTTRLPQSPTWKCKEHCKSWNELKDRAKVTPCLSETMQVNKSRSMRKWWRCQAACSNCVHCIYISSESLHRYLQSH